MKKNLFILLLFVSSLVQIQAQNHRTPEKAKTWYAKQPFLVGANFVPSTAINQLEMLRAETFDPATIDKELGWATAIGMNTMRIFLHDLLYSQNLRASKKGLMRY